MDPFFWNARARNTHVEENLNHPFPAQAYALENAKTEYAANFSEWSHKHWQFKRVIKHLTLA